jgi:hypothetical protein
MNEQRNVNSIIHLREKYMRFKLLRSQSGQASMMMALAAAGLVTVAALSVAKWSKETLQIQKSNDPSKAAQLIRENILNSLSSSGVWEQSLSNNANLSTCIADKSCAFDGNSYVDFDLYSNSGSVLLKSSDASNGFDLKGMVCNSFNSTNGNDSCPLRFVTQVRADCSVLVAGQCDVQLRGILYYAPLQTGSSLLARSLNSDKYGFNFHLGAIDGTMQAACVALGGSFNKSTLGCDVSNVNLSSSKTGMTLAQLTQLCPAAQQTVANAISSGTLSEVTLSQCQLGADLSKSCINGNTLAGSNVDGSIDCRQIPDGNYCLVGSNVIPSGSASTFYQTASVAFGSTCKSESRACVNGEISGSYTNTACVVEPATSCNLDGQTVANGASIVAYKVGRPDESTEDNSEYQSAGHCLTQSRTCTNGVLSGSTSYSLNSCSPSNGNSCNFGDRKMSSGQSITAYQSSHVSYGGSCVSGQVSCNNGVLSGNDLFPYRECEKDQGHSCDTAEGKHVVDGQGSEFYRVAKADAGRTCTQMKVEKVCKDGVMVGDVKASYEHCEENHSSCRLGDRDYQVGEKVKAYSIDVGSAANSCNSFSNSKVLVCQAGVWADASGSGQDISSFIYRKCSTPKGADCRITTKDNQNRFIRNGGVSVLYSVSTSQSCSTNSVSISCSNGVTNVAAASYYGHCGSN